MPSIDIDALNISTGDIDVNLLEIDNQKVSTKQHNEWEVYDSKKMGYLNKLGYWENVTLELVGEIKDSRANKAFATIHCRWTNRTSYIELKLDKESGNDKKIFKNTTQIHRRDYSSKVIVIVKFLENDLKIGDSKEFSLFVDNREPPEIDSGLFHIEDAHFSEDGDWTELVKEFKGEMFFTSLRQLDYDQKTTIYYNIDFPGINNDALDEDNLKGARGTFFKLFTAYLGSGAFVSECMDISFYLRDKETEARNNEGEFANNEDGLKAKLHDYIHEDFEDEVLKHSPSKILQIASMIYPSKKLTDKDRLHMWWTDSYSENSYTLLERVHMAYQKTYEPLSKFKEGIKDLSANSSEEEDE
jgi:hypothetical protein